MLELSARQRHQQHIFLGLIDGKGTQVLQQGREAECLLDSGVQPFVLFSFELGLF